MFLVSQNFACARFCETNTQRIEGESFPDVNTIIRVNQIEVTREKSVGEDERAMHTPSVGLISITHK